jgi:uncharacterized protein (TIGR03790 family)
MAMKFLFLISLMCFFSMPVSAKISVHQVAVVVNVNDTDSRLIAAYYQEKRGIPQQNIIEVRFPPGQNSISEETFKQLYQQVKDKTPEAVQYYALAWTQPFKVDCMSVTSAFAFGFDERFCAKGCRETRVSAYFDSDSEKPKDELGVTPTMMLAGSSLQQIYNMIDRGVAADGSKPIATAYLMNTSDKARNVRSHFYPNVRELRPDKMNIEQINSDVLKNKNDVMFYFTGLKQVEEIDKNQYLPGAMADHLTSTGGQLTSSRQMSILRWLDAGATASYGTVVEPCAFTQKFPSPCMAIQRYTKGESLIEAYWKSVARPGQGVFVGEPLAAPYADSVQ